MNATRKLQLGTSGRVRKFLSTPFFSLSVPSSRSLCHHPMCDHPYQDPSAFPFMFLQSKRLAIAFSSAVEENLKSFEHTLRTPQNDFSERESTFWRILPPIYSSSISWPVLGGPIPLSETRSPKGRCERCDQGTLAKISEQTLWMTRRRHTKTVAHWGV